MQAICAVTNLPFVGIGGVTLANYRDVLNAGADGAAIVSAILSADDIESTVQKFVQLSL